jgi:hypothetical protein
MPSVFSGSYFLIGGPLATLLVLAACGDNDGGTGGGSSSTNTDSASSDVTPTTSGSSESDGAGCDPMAPFGTPVPLMELNTSDDEEMPRLTPDELTVVFARHKTLLYATRSSVSEPFGPAEAPPGFDEVEGWSPWLSPDGLTLYFSLDSYSANPSILVARRNSTADDFGKPEDAGLDTGGLEWHPYLSPDQSDIWFVNEAVGESAQIWRAPIAGDGTIGTPAVVPELAGASIDWAPVISADGLEIFFGRGASGNYDIYSARRTSTADPFGTPGPVTELVKEGQLNRDLPGWLSPDRCRLYFSRGGTAQDLYYADR